MSGKTIGEQFNARNRVRLWQLRTYHGALDHTYCTPAGKIEHVTAEHADRLIAEGRNIYVDIPWDTSDPNDPQRGQVGMKWDDEIEERR